MKGIRRLLKLQNRIQEYEWGSYSAIPELLGLSAPALKPKAELWMGAHPLAPSAALVGGRSVPLPELVRRDPEGILGPEAALRFAGRLPFLFKVLAAERPLSIQAHPDLEQARQGFRRENDAGIAPDDPRRSYRDEDHKPEVVCALSPFWVLDGFRPLPEMIRLLESAAPRSLAGPLARLRAEPAPAGLRRFFTTLLNLGREDRLRALEEANGWARREARQHPSGRVRELPEIAGWLLRLQAVCPEDIGILGPLILNLLRLEPGQALFHPSGILHAYLEGVAVELMANSDNVIRGGLTNKPVDVPELLRVLRFESPAPHRIQPQPGEPADPAERLYRTPAEEFLLAELRLEEGLPYRSPEKRSVEILLCVDGRGSARSRDGGELEFMKGVSFLAPAALGSYELTGRARLFRASVPLP